MTRLRLAPVWLLASVLVLPRDAAATLTSESSSFGPDTVTRDSETGLRWLDLTLSAGLSHAQVLQELGPGGMFAGFEVATRAEVSELYVHTGIDVSSQVLDDFVPQNYAPIAALAVLVGQLGSNGNCGAGCTFNFTAAFLAGPPPSPGFLPVASIAWFDNSAGQDPGTPAAPVGRAILDGSAVDEMSTTRGTWLVPEPGASLLLMAGGAVLALAGRRRSTPRAAPSRPPP